MKLFTVQEVVMCSVRAFLFTLAVIAMGNPAYSQVPLFGHPAFVNDADNDSERDARPELAGGGNGVWIAVWGSLDDLGGTIGTDNDVLYSRTADDGATWSAPTFLNAFAETDSRGESDVKIETDGNGNWMAVWRSDDTNGATGLDRDIFYTISTDDGLTWSTSAPINTDAISDNGEFKDELNPQIAPRGDGTWVAVWSMRDSMGSFFEMGVRSATFNQSTSTWSEPVVIHTNDQVDSMRHFFPSIKFNGTSKWITVFHSPNDLGGPAGTDYDILISSSTDNGATWTPPVALTSSANSDSGDDLTAEIQTDGSGNWIAMWESLDTLGGSAGTDTDIFVARSSDDGVTWTGPSLLLPSMETDGSAFDLQPEIDTDGSGNWIVTWWSDTAQFGLGADDDALVALSTDNGASWTGPGVMNATAGSDSNNDTHPDIVHDGVGTWMGVWASLEDLSGGSGADSDIAFAKVTTVSTLMDNLFSHPAFVNDANNDSGLDAVPRVAGGGNGVWVAIWGSQDDLGGTIGTDFDILYSRTADDGATWSTPSFFNAFAATDDDREEDAAIETDGNGNWMAVWRSEGPNGGTGLDSDIFYTISTDDGLTWSTSAPINTDAISDNGAFKDELHPKIAPRGDGTWVAVWSIRDSMGSFFEMGVRSATFDQSTSIWTAPVIIHTNNQVDSMEHFVPAIKFNGTGKWITVFHSPNDLGGPAGTDYDILFASSSDNGATWTAPAVLTSAANSDTGDDLRANLATDEAGNWVATWHSVDTLGGPAGTDTDIFVARSSDDGVTWIGPSLIVPSMKTDGSALDIRPEIDVDGSGHWIVTWRSETTQFNLGADLDALIALSTNNGVSWAGPGVMNIGAASDSKDDTWPYIAHDGAGTWMGVWGSLEDFTGESGADFDIAFAKVVPRHMVSPLALDFGTTIFDRDGPIPLESLIFNGSLLVPLNFLAAGIEITGPDASSFVIAPDTSPSLSLGASSFVITPDTSPLLSLASRSVTVEFAPSDEGDKSAMLVITTNDLNNATVNIPLSGVSFGLSAAKGWTLYGD